MSDQEIIPDNIRVLQPVYGAAMFEELRMFQVADRLVELFQSGRLPLGHGKAGSKLYKYGKGAALRASEADRRRLYTRVFGLPGGDDAGGTPNREFNQLWLRFVSSVSAFAREQAKQDNDPTTAEQEVREAGRNLAVNLSLHGFGWSYFAAGELQKQVAEVINLLALSEIREAYGARDLWQVIDQVAALELGGSRNSSRYRTLAKSGTAIIGWLGSNARKLSGVSQVPLRADSYLVSACEQWLAVSATSDDEINDLSQPEKAWEASGGS